MPGRRCSPRSPHPSFGLVHGVRVTGTSGKVHTLPCPPATRHLPARCRPALLGASTPGMSRSTALRCVWTATTMTPRSCSTSTPASCGGARPRGIRKLLRPAHPCAWARSASRPTAARSRSSGRAASSTCTPCSVSMASTPIPARPSTPPAGFDVVDLTDAIRYAVRGTAFTTPAHPARPEGWRDRMGHPRRDNPDVRPIQLRGRRPDHRLAGRRLPGQVRHQVHRDHRAHLPTAQLRNRSTSTPTSTAPTPNASSPRAGTSANTPTGGACAAGRTCSASAGTSSPSPAATRSPSDSCATPACVWRRTVDTEQPAGTDGETTLVVGVLTYAGTGWRTLGDAMLANTSAAMARAHREPLARNWPTSSQ